MPLGGDCRPSCVFFDRTGVGDGGPVLAGENGVYVHSPPSQLLVPVIVCEVTHTCMPMHVLTHSNFLLTHTHRCSPSTCLDPTVDTPRGCCWGTAKREKREEIVEVCICPGGSSVTVSK